MKDGLTVRLTVGQVLDLLIDGAPDTLDTLNEIAAALADDANLAATLTEAIALKADEVDTDTPNLSAKTTPVDADSFRIWDVAGSVFKKVTFANLKAWMLALIGAQVVTPWVAYSPTLAGVGTATAIKCRSRRVGANLEVEASFTTGTVTASTFEMSLGFNGASGAIVIDNYWNGVRPVLGVGVINVVDVPLYVLGLGNSGVVNLSATNASRESLTPVAGTALGSSSVLGVHFSVPISGWN